MNITQKEIIRYKFKNIIIPIWSRFFLILGLYSLLHYLFIFEFRLFQIEQKWVLYYFPAIILSVFSLFFSSKFLKYFKIYYEPKRWINFIGSLLGFFRIVALYLIFITTQSSLVHITRNVTEIKNLSEISEKSSDIYHVSTIYIETKNTNYTVNHELKEFRGTWALTVHVCFTTPIFNKRSEIKTLNTNYWLGCVYETFSRVKYEDVSDIILQFEHESIKNFNNRIFNEKSLKQFENNEIRDLLVQTAKKNKTFTTQNPIILDIDFGDIRSNKTKIFVEWLILSLISATVYVISIIFSKVYHTEGKWT